MFEYLTNPLLLDLLTLDLEEHKIIPLVGRDNLTDTELQYQLWRRWLSA